MLSDKQQHEAIVIITELLRGGEHEGKCDNDDDPYSSCERHLAAAEMRRKRANDFLLQAVA